MSGSDLETAPRPLVLHLASRSARRRRMLAEFGVRFEAEDPGVDDGVLEPGETSPANWVAALAYMKARAAVERLARAGRATGPVLGADTTVVKSGRIIGQPRDAGHAREIIALLESGEHDVLTGAALLDAATGRRVVILDRARVGVGHIGTDRIERYISSDGWRGKAGAYNLVERQAEGWPIAVEGDPTTVMGLPMRRLIPWLRRVGVLEDRPVQQAEAGA